MSVSPFRTQKHTNYHHPAVNHLGFSNFQVKNQPNTGLHDKTPISKHWWQGGDILKLLMGITAYINIGTHTGFGINDTRANWGTVPKFMDRASPFMWI